MGLSLSVFLSTTTKNNPKKFFGKLYLSLSSKNIVDVATANFKSGCVEKSEICRLR